MLSGKKRSSETWAINDTTQATWHEWKVVTLICMIKVQCLSYVRTNDIYYILKISDFCIGFKKQVLIINCPVIHLLFYCFIFLYKK